MVQIQYVLIFRIPIDSNLFYAAQKLIYGFGLYILSKIYKLYDYVKILLMNV